MGFCIKKTARWRGIKWKKKGVYKTHFKPANFNAHKNGQNTPIHVYGCSTGGLKRMNLCTTEREKTYRKLY